MQMLCFILNNFEASDKFKIKSRFLLQLYFLKEVVGQSRFIKSNAMVATAGVCYLWVLTGAINCLIMSNLMN